MVTHKTVGLFMFVGVILGAAGVAFTFGPGWGLTCASAFFLILAATGIAYLRENK